jgi:hypothetical protein
MCSVTCVATEVEERNQSDMWETLAFAAGHGLDLCHVEAKETRVDRGKPEETL